MIAPLPGTGDEPTIFGATFEIRNPLTNEAATFDLPSRNWRVNRRGSKYKYVDRGTRDGVRSVILQNGRQLNVVVKGTGISLNESSQDELAAILVVGALRYCAVFDFPSIRTDRPCKFVAKNAAVPVVCPASAIPAEPLL